MGMELNHVAFFLYVLGKGTKMMPAILKNVFVFPLLFLEQKN